MNNLPHNSKLNIGALAGVFNSTSTSYKFYWFYAILQEIKEGNEKVELNQIFIRMVANTWYANHYYKLKFGSQDRLGNLGIEALGIKKLRLKVNTKPDKVIEKISHFIKSNPNHSFTKNLKALKQNVPYRFIRPWLVKETKGLKDAKVDKKIRELGTKGAVHKLPYYFVDDSIVFDKDWVEYFTSHAKVVNDYCLFNLLQYLQKRNLNVPNIISKLFPPTEKDRNLTKERKFWKIVHSYQEQPFRCIFSQQVIKEKFALDHFIPWSFVAHNQIWNLIPIEKSVNSKKGNNLPDLNQYLNPFSEYQYNLYQTAYKIREQNGIRARLDDYVELFSTNLENINSMDKGLFFEKIKQQMEPNIVFAKGNGFTSNWTYQK